jgi:hypothetical protein
VSEFEGDFVIATVFIVEAGNDDAGSGMGEDVEEYYPHR